MAVLLTGGLCLSIYLLLIFMILSSFGIPEKTLGPVVKNKISEKIDTDCSLRDIDIQIYPRPSLELKHFKVTKNNNQSAVIPVLKIYPKLFPLLTGNLQVKKIDLTRAQLNLNLKNTNSQKKTNLLLEADQLLSSLKSFMDSLPRPFGLQINDSKIQISLPQDQNFTLNHVLARIHLTSELEATLEVSSNLWQKLELNLRGDSANLFPFKSSLKITKVNPYLINYLLPESAAWHIQRTDLSFQADISCNELNDFQISFQGQIPKLKLVKDSISQSLSISKFEAIVKQKKNSFDLNLRQIQLDKPELQIQGRFSLKPTSPAINYVLTGKKIDHKTFHQLGQFYPENKTLRKIFSIVRDGVLTNFKIQNSVSSWKQALNNIRISGTLEQARIYLSKFATELDQVKGNFQIENQVLTGKQASALTDNCRFSSANLQIGLNDDLQPFYLDSEIDLELQALKKIFQYTNRFKSLEKKFYKLENLSGKIQGKIKIQDLPQSQMEVEFSSHDFALRADYPSIPGQIKLTGQEMSYSHKKLSVDNFDLTLGSSKLNQVNATLLLEKSPFLTLKSPKAIISLKQVITELQNNDLAKNILSRFKKIEGTINLTSLKFEGSLKASPENWIYRCQGRLTDFYCRYKGFSLPIALKQANLILNQRKLQLTEGHSPFREGYLKVNGCLDYSFQKISSAWLDIQGHLGKGIVNQLSQDFIPLSDLFLTSPVTISQTNLYLKPNGLSGQFDLTLSKEKQVRGKIVTRSNDWFLKDLNFKDDFSNCRIDLGCQDKVYSLDFNGTLDSKSFKDLFQDYTYSQGQIKGDYQTKIKIRPFQLISASGNLDSDNLRFSFKPIEKFLIKKARFIADPGIIQVPSADISWRENDLSVKGKIRIGEKINSLDLKVKTNQIDFDQLKNSLIKNKEKNQFSLPVPVLSPNFKGNLDLSSQEFLFQDRSFRQIQTKMIIRSNRLTIDPVKAQLCSLPIIGSMSFSPDNIAMELTSQAQNRDLNATLVCLLDSKEKVTGDLDLKISLQANSPSLRGLKEAIKGPFSLQARDGRIYKMHLFSKILAFLNTTEIFFGHLPDYSKKGFGYYHMYLNGHVQGETLYLDEGFLDGKTMEIGFQGQVHLPDHSLNLTFLIAPLKTLDRVLNKIPGFKEIIGKNLVSIPVQVTGTYADPKIVPLSPKAVSNELIKTMKRTLKLPLKIFQPFLPKDSD